MYSKLRIYTLLACLCFACSGFASSDGFDQFRAEMVTLDGSIRLGLDPEIQDSARTNPASLIFLTDSTNPVRRAWACQQLAGIATNSYEYRCKLKELVINDPHEMVQTYALLSLTLMNAHIVPDLLEFYQKANTSWVASRALDEIANFGGKADVIIPELMSMLADGNRDVVPVLASTGKKALPYLKEMYRSQNLQAANLARKTLEAMGSVAVPLFIKDLKGKDKFLKVRAIQSLRKIGSQAEPSLKHMKVIVMNKEEEQIQELAFRAILSIEKDITNDSTARK